MRCPDTTGGIAAKDFPAGPVGRAPLRMKAKVCLVGEAAVGKTSLIRRFTVNAYDDRYVMTIGAKGP